MFRALRTFLMLAFMLAFSASVWATPVTFTTDPSGSSVSLTKDFSMWAKLTGELVLGPTTFVLDDNTSQTLDFFKLTASGFGLGEYDVSATLSFLVPSIQGTGSGSVLFASLGGYISGGILHWNSATIPDYFTLTDGNKVKIDFEDGIAIVCGDSEIVHAYVTNLGGGTPVPEPCTMFLLGSGLIGIAGIRGRFKKA
ncbi:MAG: PEP-CTERM sorting domain-containing protein [Syntrophobacteraceae bacterium]